MNSSEQDLQAKRSEKRRELFKQQQQQMLQGYNLNSFKSSKPKKHKSKNRERSSDKHRHKTHRDSSKQNAVPSDDKQKQFKVVSMQQTGDKKIMSNNQQEFADILDQMSLNSSSKINQQNTGNIKINFPTSKSKPITSREKSNLNLGKSQSGLIKSILKGQTPIDMKMHDASLTINNKNNTGQNALNSLLDKSDIHLEINDDESNRRQFEEENPYGDTQKLNMTDYQGRSLQKRHEENKSKKDSRRRSAKMSPFEKYESIRFQCYELQQKMMQMNTLVQGLTQKIREGEGVNYEKQTVEVSLDVIEMMVQHTQDINNEFANVQHTWTDNFEEQQRSNSRQRSKRKKMKMRLKSMENKSQMAIDQQKEFEKSLHEITKAHNDHTNQMGQQLDQIEDQVNSLKHTRDFLSGKYENQLDKAYQEMINFYTNLEKTDPNEIDSDNMSIENVFFIKPTYQISQSIKHRSKSHLRISYNGLSTDNHHIASAPRCNSVVQQQRTPHIVPKLQMERLKKQTQNSPEPPRIINCKPKSGRGSSRQYQQTSQRSNIVTTSMRIQQNNLQPPKSKENRNNCPSGRGSIRNAYVPSQVSQRGSARGTAQKQTAQLNSNSKVQDTPLKNQNNNQPAEDYITNPVMMGAMKLPESKFDNQYEEDFEGANVTLDMNTERLRQFPEDYEAINSIDNHDQRILLKQVAFMKYEGILKKQAKMERKRKKKALKAQKEALEQEKANQNSSGANKKGEGSNSGNVGELKYKPKSMIPTPTHKSTFGFGKFQNQQSSKGSLRGMQHMSSNSSIGTKNMQPKGLGMNERHEYNDNSQLTSRFSLHSALSALDTVEVKMAQQKYKPQDVNRTELLECDEEFAHGLKTATQTSLIKHYEEEFQQKEIIRQQHKQEEKKLDYNSTFNSKMSVAVKQTSCGSKQQDILKQYGSNNSNQNQQPIMIHDSENQSMNSEFKEVQRLSHKKVQRTEQQMSMISKQNTSQQNSKVMHNPNIDINRSFNNASGIDQSINMSLDQLPNEPSFKEEDQKLLLHYEGNRYEEKSKPLLTVPDFNQQMSHPSNPTEFAQQSQCPDESIISGPSGYQRYIDMNNEYQESPLVKNSKNHDSYINSEATPISQSNHDKSQVEYNNNEIDIDDFNHVQSQVYFDQMNNPFKQRLPLDVIQERQSEFSQSMITNAQKNTHRSMLSKNQHYNNMNQNKLQQSFLPSNRLSDCHNQSSANRKNSSRGIQESFDKKNTDFEEHQFKNVIGRSSSVAHTHRNPDNSFQLPNVHNASINDQNICIDASLVHNSRNQQHKNSSSNKEMHKKENLQMYRQPSAGNFDRDRDRFFQNIDQDISQITKPLKQQAAIPPTGKQIKQASEKKVSYTRNNMIAQNRSNNQQYQAQYLDSNLRPGGGAFPHQLSYRSQQNNIGGESFRDIQDRSYFDESPAIFEKAADNELDHNQSASRDKNPEEKNTISSRQVENSLQIYRTDETGDTISNNPKFGSSIRTNLIMQSLPQSSCQSSYRESKKNLKKLKQNEQRHESFNQIDSLHHLSSHQQSQDLILSSNLRKEGLDKINENHNENEDLDINSRLMIRSNSHVQIRDKEFYEMCLDEEDVANCEQNLFEALQMKMLMQSKQNGTNIHNQSNDQAQMLTSNFILNKLSQKYQTQNKNYIDPCVVDQIGQTPSIVDQNSSQQQTRGQRTFAKFLQDPSRLLASINDRQGQPYNNTNNQLGTNFLTKSLDDGTIHMFNHMMHPTQYKRTLMMMLNLHNNFLHSVNSGALFTMQRGQQTTNRFIDDQIINQQIAQSFNNLTNLVRSRREFINNNQSTNGVSGVINGLNGLNNADKQGVTIQNGDQALKSLGGDPVNISSLLLGAKQQTAERINVGSITIVEDESRNLLDRKLYMEANNSSQQTKGRKFNQNNSRNHNGGQISGNTDFSNLQTKQLGIFKARNSQNSVLNNKNQKIGERKTSESINHSQIIEKSVVHDQSSQELQNLTKSTPNNNKGCYGNVNDSVGTIINSDKLNSKRDHQNSNDRIDAVNDSRSTIKPVGTVSSSNQANFMNLLVGLKQIQKKTNAGNSSHRSGSDISLNRDARSATNFRTITQVEHQSIPQENIKKILKLQQHKNTMNLSSSLTSAKQLEACNSNLMQLKSKSVPKSGIAPTKKLSAQNSTVGTQGNIINKVKLILNDSSKKQVNIKQMQSSLQLSNNETIKNFNTITGNSHMQSQLVAKINQSQLSNRGKPNLIVNKNQRTNSSCMMPSQTRCSSNGSAIMIKKNSNVTTLSSARGSSSAGQNGKNYGLKQNNIVQIQKVQDGNIFIDQNGKKYIKKKVNLKQGYNSQQPNSAQAYVSNINSN